jgi:excinuclease UvrABC ATPase subunit
LQADFDKLLDPDSPYLDAVLPRRDSKLGQALLKKLAHKYDVDVSTKRADLPDWFHETVIHGDKELLKIPMGEGKYTTMNYKGIEDVLIDQYNKGLLTVDFQAMLEMRTCPDCQGARLRKESLHVFLKINKGNKKKEKAAKGKSSHILSDPS